jgi:hypothetical protein
MTDSLAARWAGRKRTHGILAGWLFILGSLLSLPSALLADPTPPSTYYAMTAVGVCSGVACLVVPWERLPLWAFHALAAAATVEVAVVVRLFDSFYALMYFVIAVYVAFVFPGPREVILQLLFISFVIELPIIYDHEHAREAVRFGLFAIPIVAIGAEMVSHMRHQLDEREREYAHLAGETGQLAAVIMRRLGDRVSIRPRNG